jgi:hypothetical protein
MSPSIPVPVRTIITVVLIALAALALAVPPASAAEVSGGVCATVLPALDMMDIVQNRARLIQFSIGAVALGIALLWWGNKAQ